MKKNAKAIFDGVDQHLLSLIVKEQGPPSPGEKPEAYARRMIRAMEAYADGKRTPFDSAVLKTSREIERNFDRTGFTAAAAEIEREKKITAARIERAKKNRLDYEALKAFFCKALREGLPLSAEMAGACADILDGTMKPPPKAKRGGGYMYERRNFILGAAVWLIREHYLDIDPSRNTATADISGADIVARVAGETYDITVEAYQKYKMAFRFIKLMELELHYSRTGEVLEAWPVAKTTNL